MNIVGIILLGSVFALSAAGLFVLHWAGRTGQFAHAERAALLPFDESEPEGVMTDVVLGVRRGNASAIQSTSAAVKRDSEA